jgi:hypothetical protein
LIEAGHNQWLNLELDQDQFKVEFTKPADVTKLDFYDNALQAAEILYNKYRDRPLYLALSGGIDSELVANVFLQKNIPFQPIILKIDSFNLLESWYAEYWCKQNKIQPKIVNLSVNQYVEQIKKFFPLLRKLNNLSQTSILYLYDYVDKLNGYCIYAAGDINLDTPSKKFYCHSLDFISDLLGNGHPTSFFMYTPELAYSYVNQFDINVSEQENKLGFYKVTPRPKIDYIVPLHNDPQIAEIIKKCCYLSQKTICSVPYWYGQKEQLLERLSGKKMLQ